MKNQSVKFTLDMYNDYVAYSLRTIPKSEIKPKLRIPSEFIDRVYAQ